MFLLLVLIVLHGPSGREITLNATAIVSLQAAIPDKPNELVTGAAQCVVSTMDGKFFSTTETCEAIRKLIEEAMER